MARHRPVGLFAALSIAFPLCYPSTSFPLFSISRFGLVIFPILGISAVLLAVYGARWSLGSWVA